MITLAIFEIWIFLKLYVTYVTYVTYILMDTLDLQYLFIVYVHRNSSAYVMLFVGVFASISLAHFFLPEP